MSSAKDIKRRSDEKFLDILIQLWDLEFLCPQESTYMTPHCYNREPFAGRWMHTGRFKGAKPILRWAYPWFTDRCGTRAGRGIGPNGENYADANGYACDGCRWME